MIQDVLHELIRSYVAHDSKLALLAGLSPRSRLEKQQANRSSSHRPSLIRNQSQS